MKTADKNCQESYPWEDDLEEHSQRRRKLNTKSKNAKRGSQDLNSLIERKEPLMRGEGNDERQRLSMMSMEDTSIGRVIPPTHGMTPR